MQLVPASKFGVCGTMVTSSLHSRIQFSSPGRNAQHKRYFSVVARIVKRLARKVQRRVGRMTSFVFMDHFSLSIKQFAILREKTLAL